MNPVVVPFPLRHRQAAKPDRREQRLRQIRAVLSEAETQRNVQPPAATLDRLERLIDRLEAVAR